MNALVARDAVSLRATPRMRVLLALTEVLGHGGIQRFNKTLLAALSDLGCDATVLSLNDVAGESRPLSEAPSALIHGFGHSKLNFSAALAAQLAGRTHDALIVGHVHFSRLVVAASRLPGRRLPRRVLLIAHGLEIWHILRGGTRRAVGAVSDIVSVSSYTQAKILEQAPELSSKKLHIFPNALASTWVEWASRARQEAMTPMLEQPYILAVTRLGATERAKGIVTLLEAYSMISTSGVHLAVAGGGDDLGFLKAIAERLGVAARVHFVGTTTDAQLMSLYRGCSLFVLPSGQEGFGIVFLEAMYFQAPVIAAREKGAVDVVTDGKSGLLVDFGDVVALRLALDRALSDEALRQRLRQGGNELVSGEGSFTFAAFRKRAAVLLGLSPPVASASAALQS